MMSFAIDGLKENVDTQCVCPVQKNVLQCTFVIKCAFSHAQTVYVIYSDIVLGKFLSGGSSASQNKLPKLILGYIYISKQLHWLDFILLKFITYDIAVKLF